MIKKVFIQLVTLLCPVFLLGQNYTSYQTGNTTDFITKPFGGICLMGGASEDDNAMKWFLEQSNGGDILVLRASGADGYNNYLYSQLGIPVNSVETIVFNNALASNNAYIHQKIQQAEAIWFAGGDQWNYISYWRNTAIDSLVNNAIKQRNVVIGGTSAGMAIQGEYYFSAQNGTISSATALANPYQLSVTVDSSEFIKNDYLANVITDTHFDNPDRKGRLVVFLSRIYADYDVQSKAIACDEYTAVCIDTNGVTKVFGGFPTYDDNAYFIQTNCELSNQTPENCTVGSALTWDLGGQALKVYRIKGTSDGTKTFNLLDWKTGTGGDWLHWSVANGNFLEKAGSAIVCNTSSTDISYWDEAVKIFPNPASGQVSIKVNKNDIPNYSFNIYNSIGQKQSVLIRHTSFDETILDISNYSKGVYFIRLVNSNNQSVTRTIICE